MATSNKSVPVIAIGIVALVAVAYFGMNYPTDGSDAAGTVAPAERYRADQIGAGDVELGDQAIQEFMQTDVFTALTNDAAFRNALKSDAFRAALASDSFR
ncbi:MAG: hypothetical protein OEY82_08295, partial [Gammaproteobacteria bacterium]|nr:hypothetical protein [Gammaproteobacteria bacterium]